MGSNEWLIEKLHNQIDELLKENLTLRLQLNQIDAPKVVRPENVDLGKMTTGEPHLMNILC